MDFIVLNLIILQLNDRIIIGMEVLCGGFIEKEPDARM
jgi:hypothetical protein